jgi:hypothetical protein
MTNTFQDTILDQVATISGLIVAAMPVIAVIAALV